MACKFSCFLNYLDALKVNDVGIFQSDNGDQFKVKYRSNVCRDLLIKIEWTIPKQILVTVKLYNTAFKTCFSSKGVVANGKKAFMKLRGAFNISNARDYKVLCIINLLPYVKFNKCSELPSKVMDSGSTDPESQCLPVDRKDKIKPRNESSDVCSNSTTAIGCKDIAGECKNSQPVIDDRYRECLLREGIEYECSSSNATSIKPSFSAETKTQTVSENVKLLNVDIIDEKIMRNRETSIHKLEPKKIFEENSSAMEVDFTKLSSENFNRSSNKATQSEKQDLKNKEVFLSNNITSKINQAAAVEIHSLIKNKNSSYSSDIYEKVANTADKKTGSNDVKKTNNETLEKTLSTLPNDDTCTYTQNADPLKIDIQSPVVRNKSPPLNDQKTPEVIEDTEMQNRVIDNHKSQESSSLKTGLVFQSLLNNLSAEDSGIELTYANEKLTSSSDDWIKSSPESNISKEKIYPVMESELKGLSMDMLDLLTSGDLADAIITNGENHIKVHRSIVSARSSVLKEIFIKRRQDDVKYQAVVDIPSCILEDVVIFLYVGLIYIKSSKMADELHQVAERYRINDLIDICSKHESH